MLCIRLLETWLKTKEKKTIKTNFFYFKSKQFAIHTVLDVIHLFAYSPLVSLFIELDAIGVEINTNYTSKKPRTQQLFYTVFYGLGNHTLKRN